MRIRTLEINGFKSFADRVVLAFDRGISAIVGPNGCGKSNVVDAVRWVMGEQNPRHLRGRSMDDVVFGGSERRTPVGFAEVVLTLDASDGSAPPAYASFSEVQIARRLYRTGESEYLINRVPVRLRDVADFFLDTGAGVRGYTIVEQGQIASIVSSRPEDRRTIFEEAAGIGKYRQRRLETERKLEATEHNLLRLNDILGELRRQIASLDRQARRATRYKELAAKVRELELGLARAELEAHDARNAELERELERLRAESAALEARIASEGARAATERSAHLERERALQTNREALLALRSEIQALENKSEYERREREGLVRLADEREGEIAELEQQLSAHRAAEAEVLQELSAIEARAAADEEGTARRDAELRERSERAAELRGRRDALQRRLLELSSESAALGSRTESLAERRRDLELRLRRLEESLEASGLERESALAEVEALAARRREALAEQDEHGRVLAEALRHQAECTRAAAARQSELAELRGRLERTTARIESLREAERVDGESGRQALESLPELARSAVRGRLSDVLQVAEGYERALEAALGARLQSLLVDDERSALALLARLRERAGRATVLARARRENEESAGFVPLGERLLNHVSAKAPFESLLRRLLVDVYVVPTLDEAVQRYGLQRPPAVFVTPAGELLDRGGALTGGAAAPPGTLARAGEIRSLAHDADALGAECRRLEELAAREQERLAALAAEIENARNRRHTAELAVLHYEKDLERLRERAKSAEVALEHGRAERTRLSEALEALGAEVEALDARLAATSRERADAEGAAERLDAEASGVAREAQALERRLVQQRVELAEHTARRERLRAERERLRAAVDEGREWLARRRDEVGAARERASSLERSAAEATAAIAECLRREEAARGEQEALREAWEGSGRAVTEAEAGERAAAGAREELRARLSAVELANQEAQLRRDQLVERVRERHQVELASHVFAPGAVERPEAERREELTQLQESLRALGDVHLGAIEEYEEVSERNRYLSEQKQDLEQSIEKLRRAIVRINATSRARFRETFDAVDAEFQKLFPRLFRGGRAHLALTPAEDVLDAGIEIHAQPPGKKLQSVNLLSGGEKSLTAIALLFAVFTVKPSPFFLLDEVDAALDDANVGRFNDLVRAMANDSQFLLITHNKGTIEIARTLYGITMEDPGLSKLVTVDLVS